jgi:BASS family bile acid:Na+ symporter
MKKIGKYFLNLYLLWIVSAYTLGYLAPELFMWFTRGSWMTWTLALVMLGMGLTLKVEDFKQLFKMPRTLLLAAVGQYTIMPFCGWLIAMFLGLPVEFAVGFILVACCPGGTASNMIAYIARGNMALSVTSTAVSTLLAIIMTPLLCKLLAGQLVHVDAWSMFLSVLRIAFIPVLLGVFINYKFPNFVKKLGQTGPVVSTWALMFISGGIIAPAVIDGREILIQYAGQLALAASLLHIMAFALGYVVTRLLRYDHTIAKTISIEMGMQNGGLGAVLAKNSFPLYMPLVAIPAVFCSVLQNVIGGILATIWRLADSDSKKTQKNSTKEHKKEITK